MHEARIVAYNDIEHREQVVALWRLVFGYEAAHNKPELVIDVKSAVDDGLFFAAEVDSHAVGTVMAGYDGHRGWIYSLAVLPEYRRREIGTLLMDTALEALTQRGCIKVNLQVVAGNDQVLSFYEAYGFSVEDRISMGKRL